MDTTAITQMRWEGAQEDPQQTNGRHHKQQEQALRGGVFPAG